MRPSHRPSVSMRTVVIVWAVSWSLWGRWCGRGDADESSPEVPLRCVVLRDGRIVWARVSREGAYYRLQRATGDVLLPQEAVRCVADSLELAYQFQREALEEPTADALLRLAAWCYAQGLDEAARRDIDAALRLDPASEKARELLQLLAQESQAAPVNRSKQKSVAPGLPIEPDTPRKPIGDLSQAAAQQFTAHVQPLLLRTCARTGCHAMHTPQAFRLRPVAYDTPSSPKITEHNLQQVLRWIDVQQPQHSPLLSRLEPHGQTRKPWFLGPVGDKQRQTIQQWVFQVARERSRTHSPAPQISSETVLHRADE
ncbi:MAG: hypothetical protein KatS3mg114_0726 [Planctomycetaceae bacterium]|nr:MAG: hypothetical protein KatS3mg114_0726 [Planctomycetaceae bacterium]